MQSIAARTRSAIAQRPHLLEALADGVLNVTAAARILDVDDTRTDTVASALRRLSDTFDEVATADPPRVRVERDPATAMLATHIEVPADAVAIEVEGADLGHHRAVIGRLGVLSIDVYAATMAADSACYVIPETRLSDGITAVEQPADAAVYMAIHSSATRVNGR